jgi:rare lipoprotein A
MNEMTAAHRTLPFGTVVRVRNLETAREAEVVINDRGPFVEGRIVDLSRAAADRLGLIAPGIAPVRLTVVRPGDGMPGATCWEVQVGAFARAENVARAERDLGSRALATRTAPAGGGLTRVRVTGLATLSGARALAGELDGTYPGAVPVPCGGSR